MVNVPGALVFLMVMTRNTLSPGSLVLSPVAAVPKSSYLTKDSEGENAPCTPLTRTCEYPVLVPERTSQSIVPENVAFIHKRSL
jgi:hypothetical protein